MAKMGPFVTSNKPSCTLSDVFDRADRYGDVVKSGRVVCRVVSVEAATSLNHMTLIARLLTRLHSVNAIDFVTKTYVGHNP